MIEVILHLNATDVPVSVKVTTRPTTPNMYFVVTSICDMCVSGIIREGEAAAIKLARFQFNHWCDLIRRTVDTTIQMREGKL